MSRLDEIRARLDAATPGPWLPESGTCPHCAADDCWQPASPGSGSGYCEATGLAVYSGPESDADDDLVAHAPADLRDLLAVVEEAEMYVLFGPQDYSPLLNDLRAALTRLDAVTDGETS